MTYSLNRLMLATALFCLAACVNGAKSIIIDVRTIEEWNAGHLASEQHLQLESVASNITELAPDKGRPIYLYCRSGNRSGRAKTILEALGYSQVTNAGGLGEGSELLTEQIIQ